MNTLIHADVFFFVTTIAVILVTTSLVIALFFLSRVLARFESIAKKIEENVTSVSDDIVEMTAQVRESSLFNFLFPKKYKRGKK